MLRRVGPNDFEATPGDTITIVAIAQHNNGVEAAGFRYGTKKLTMQPVQGHPGCVFDVTAGPKVFGAQVVFDPASPGASYDLFEEDPPGTLLPLGVSVDPLSGPIVLLQIDGVPVAVGVGAGPMIAAAPPRASRKAAPRAAARKRAKKAAKKAPKKATARTPRKATRKVARKPARKTAGATKRPPARKRGGR
jgi:hypothetical protein